MKRSIVIVVVLVITAVIFTSCARGISPYDAANGKAKCGRYVR